MQSTTGSGGGSRARVIYHAPGKSFAWLHRGPRSILSIQNSTRKLTTNNADGSFADFQKALRARLSISKNDPLVIKQIDGDYSLDIETEEEYEAFCHFAKSAPQLHISVNGGLRDQSKMGPISSSTFVSAELHSNPVPQHPAETEDPTLGKRKASQITTDLEATPSVTRKRKKRRKVEPEQSISAVGNTAITAEPLEPRAEQGEAYGNMPHNAASASIVADSNQPSTSTAKRKKKKKSVGAAQTDPTPAEPEERVVEPTIELADVPKPPLATKKRKTVVLDLLTVIPSPAATQESSSGSIARPHSPMAVTKLVPMTTREAITKPLTKKKTKPPAGSPEPKPDHPLASHSNDVEEPVPSSSTTKSKPPKRKTGQADGSSTVEKGSKQQDLVKKPAQPTAKKPKANQRKSKAAPTKRIDSPNAPGIQEIMNGVIAAAMQRAENCASTTGTDVSENLTPPPRKKSEPTVRKSRLADTSGLEAGSSTTLLEAFAPALKSVDSDSSTVRKKARARTSHAEAPQLLKGPDDPPDVCSRPDDTSPTPLPLPKNKAKSMTPLTAPPPKQKAIQKPSQAKARPESTSSEGDESDIPKTKTVPISDPDDELDAFLHAPTTLSQKSVLEDLPSHSEDEEDEVEREDMEMDEEDEAPRSKGTRQEQLKVLAKVESSSDDDSDTESVAGEALLKATQAKGNTQVTHVSEPRDIVPSSDAEGESLSQPTKSTNTSTKVVPPDSSASSPGPHVVPISNLKSAGEALDFFNGHVLDKRDPIEDDSSHAESQKGLPEDAEDPIQDADTTSTPKPKPTQRAKSRGKTANPVVARDHDAGSKTTQRSLTSPPNTMLPPPTPPRKAKGDLTFSQPLDHSTPAAPSVSRKKQLTSQTTIAGTPSRSAWTALPQGEQSTDDPAMVDELVSSPTGSTSKLPKATPVKKPTSLASIKQTPLFLPGTSQYPIPSSDLPDVRKSSSEESEDEEDEEEEEKIIVPSSQRVLRSSAIKNRATTPYRSLSHLASQRSIFPKLVESVGPAPAANRSQTKPESDDDEDDDDEDSGVTDSSLDSPPPSHIPKGRRAGAGNWNRGKKRSQLATLSS